MRVNTACKAASRYKVAFKALYVINAGWSNDTKLNITLGRELNGSFEMEAREAVLIYGNWIVDVYRNNDIILYKGD